MSRYGDFCQMEGEMDYEFDLEEMLSWTRDLYSFGMKRPGTEAGAQAEDYLLGLLKGFGVPKVTAEPVHFCGWFHDRAYIAANGSTGSVSFSAEPIVYTTFTPPAGITAPVIDLGNGSPDDFKGKDLKGKIALVTYSHGFLPYDSLDDLAYYVHDPGETLAGKGQVMTWVTEEERRVYQAVVNGGAVGFIGVFPLDLTPYLCFEGGDAFSGKLGPIPGVGLRRSHGYVLKGLLAKGPLEINLILTGETRSAVTRNIVGVIPGKSERVIQVTCHHDSMWLGATEDAAGVAIVLALAKAHAAKTHHKTLVFVLEAAECLYVLGSKGYILRHKDDLIKDLIVDLHIEHLAMEYVENENGGIVPTGEIATRGLFVTDRGPLVDIVKRAVIEHDLRRTALLPTDTPLEVPTDAAAYARGDLPVASFISPPLYWNTLEDTWDKIALDEMVPTANAFADIIAALLAVDADSIRKPGPPSDRFMKRLHEM
jgi:hypothetical protein